MGALLPTELLDSTLSLWQQAFTSYPLEEERTSYSFNKNRNTTCKSTWVSLSEEIEALIKEPERLPKDTLSKLGFALYLWVVRSECFP